MEIIKIFLYLLYIFSLWQFFLTNVTTDKIVCKINEILFLNKCFCSPGYNRNPETLICDIEIINIGNCECRPNDKLRNIFLQNFSINAHKDGTDYRCESLCRSNNELGVPFANINEWKDNQNWLQIGFYRKELPQKHKNNHLHGRLIEFVEGFEHWKYLENVNMGDVIELGCGGYTQLQNMMRNVKLNVNSVTLVDPLIYEYININNCPYRSGKFSIDGVAFDTILSNSTVESFPVTKQYDTVIVMNVLIYSYNALLFLEKVYKLVKTNGYLIFHDRWFNNIVLSSSCKMSDFYRNPIQLPKTLFDHFLNYFDKKPFFSLNITKQQEGRKGWCGTKDDERGFWVVVKKL